jgi:CBS domain-containing protein
MKLLGEEKVNTQQEERAMLAPKQSLAITAQAGGSASVSTLPVEERRAPTGYRKATHVADVMNRGMVTVQPTDSVSAAARRLWQHGRTSLPVVDAQGRLVGLLAESALLARLRSPRRGWWRPLLEAPGEGARAYQQRAGTTVAELMGPVPAEATPELSLAEAAELLAADVRELPVVAHGRLVGTVSRTDLVRVLVHAVPETGAPRTDADLIQEMQRRLAAEYWVSTRALGIDAKNGVLSLYGLVDSDEEKAALTTMARAIPGCIGVENGLVPKSQFRGHWA